ncbi:MAG: recombinase A [Candidatus Binatia bacterium]
METPAPRTDLADPPEPAELARPDSAWDAACLAGRLVEITAPRREGSAALSAAASLLVQAQLLGDPVAWVSARRSTFYPPDFEAGGIDLAALVVVRAADASFAARAADKLLRSGAFGLVVVDLDAHASVPPALASRLLGLARQHGAVVVFLTEKALEAPSIAPIVSLRVATSCRRVGTGRFGCVVEAVKDKRRTPGWTHEEILRGPPGLR